MHWLGKGELILCSGMGAYTLGCCSTLSHEGVYSFPMLHWPSLRGLWNES